MSLSTRTRVTRDVDCAVTFTSLPHHGKLDGRCDPMTGASTEEVDMTFESWQIEAFVEDHGGVVGVAALADLAGLDPAYVREWARDHDVPRLGSAFALTLEHAAALLTEVGLLADEEDEEGGDDGEEDEDDEEGDDEDEEDEDENEDLW